MDPVTLHAALRRRPFRPFRVHSVDGAVHEVLHEHQAFATTTHFFAGYDIQHGVPRDAHPLPMGQIARFEWLDEEVATGLPPSDIHEVETPRMDIESLRASLKRAPFRPFRMFLSDGSHHDVMHPELMVLERRQVALWHGFDRRGFARDLVLLDPLHITRIEQLPDGADTGSKQAG